MLRTLVRDRRVLLLVALAVLTFVLSRFVIDPRDAVETVVRTGYWVLVGVVGYFAFVASRIVRDVYRAWQPVRADVGIVCLIFIGGAVLLAHERYGYKILADELLLSGTSMGMHYSRSAAYPVRATDVQGPFQILQTVLDKRPVLFPFVVSVVHDLTGYRPDNAFYVNTVLGFVFLALVYRLGLKIGRSRWAGALLVLLFIGLPLLSQQMKGGGFELLNLVMLASLVLFGMLFAEQPTERNLAALTYCAVLVGYTRYESILVLVAVAALVLWVWWREQRVILSWPVVVAPCFLLLPLLQNRVFSIKPGAWELASRGATTPFGLHYLPNNLGHAFAFFFDTTGYQPNSPLFAALGLLAVAFFLLWIFRTLRASHTSAPADVATAWLGIGLLGIWALLMVYFWGQFDDPIIRRLSLPVHLLMAIAVAAVGASLRFTTRVWQGACILALAGLVIYSLPVMSRRAYGSTYSPAAEMEWREEFLRKFPERDYLFLDKDSVFWITHRVAASPNEQARKRKDNFILLLRSDAYSSIYVMQHFHIDPLTGERKIEPEDDIGPDFELEPVWERRILTLFVGRISRVKAIRQNGNVVAHAGPVIAPPGMAPQVHSSEEWDAAKKAYVDKWLKDLP